MFKTITNYFRYRKIIEENRKILKDEYGITIDNIYRMGKIVSIPNNKFSILKEYKNSELDIYNNLNDEVRKYISNLDRFFMSKKMSELIALYKAERIYDNGVEVFISYKLLNMVKVANVIRLVIIFSSIISLILFFSVDSIYPSLYSFILFILGFLSNIILFKKLFI